MASTTACISGRLLLSDAHGVTDEQSPVELQPDPHREEQREDHGAHDRQDERAGEHDDDRDPPSQHDRDRAERKQKPAVLAGMSHRRQRERRGGGRMVINTVDIGSLS